MKYVQVINSLSGGGAEVLAVNLHRSFLKEGREAHLIALAGKAPSGLTAVTIVSQDSPYRIGALLGLFATLRKLRLGKADILQVHLYPAQIYIVLLRSLGLLRCSLVTTEHNIYNRRRSRTYCRVLDRWMYQRFDQIICISAGVQKSLAAWVGTARKQQVIYNGVDLRPYRQARSQVAAASRGTGMFQILSVGSLTEQKNQAFLIKLLSQCKDLDWHLKLAGDGPLRGELEHQVTALGLEDHISFLGFIDTIPQLMAEADLFAHLPAWEGFGLVVVEAMAAGCPVLAGNLEGLNEIIRQERHEGILVDYADEAGLVALLRSIISGQKSLAAYREPAFARAESFSFEVMQKNYLTVYQALP